jgi:hypothetical protein
MTVKCSLSVATGQQSWRDGNHPGDQNDPPTLSTRRP